MRRWLFLAVLLTAAATAASLVVWVERDDWLAERVATHWGADGEPDQWTDRDDMLPQLMILPGLLVGMIGLSYLLPWLSPEKFKVEPFRPTYEYIMFLIVVMFAYLHAVILLAYTGAIDDVVRWIMGGSLLCLAALGNVLGKVQRNFWIGIRTPWTLASDVVWVRTHRVGAWLFVAGGLAGFVLVLLGVNGMVALAVFGVFAVAPVFYSLWLYKRLEKQGRLGDGAAT